MPTQKGTTKHSKNASQKEGEQSSNAPTAEVKEEIKQSPPPPKRGRRPATTVPMPMRSPRGGKRRRIDEDHHEEENTQRRRTRSTQNAEESIAEEGASAAAVESESESVKSQRARSRKISEMVDADPPVEPVSATRSSRNRQPSRRMIESKMDEDLLRETFGSSKRGRTSSIMKMEEPELADPPEVVRAEDDVPFTEENETKKKERQPRRQKIGGVISESDEPPASVHPPRIVTFKTVSTPQAAPDTEDAPSEVEPKRTASTGQQLKPIVPVKSGSDSTKFPNIPSVVKADGGPRIVEKNDNAVDASPALPKPMQLADHYRQGWDLPEEHRPKGTARAVVVSTSGEVIPEENNDDFVLHPCTSADFKEIGDIDDEGLMDVDQIETTHTYEVMEDGQQVVYEEVVHEEIEEIAFADLPHDVNVVDSSEQMADDDPAIDVDIMENAPEMEMGVKQEGGHNEDDDDVPPQLVPELGPTNSDRRDMYIDSDGGMIRVQSPGGTAQYVHLARGEDGTEIYVDENGEEVHMVEENQDDLRTVEFNFLDSKNICCGLCGEIVPYESLMNHHLPNHHPEVLGDSGMNLEEVPYESWLRDKLYMEKKNMEGGFRYEGAMTNEEMMNLRMRGARPLRKVSQIRVNPVEMTLPQLEMALKKKMIEKMGRKVPVSLVDKQHARCGICSSVVSLNKKFEIVHLVRHFNAWHPSAHRCAGTWQNRPNQAGLGKPLSIQDFAVIDVNMDSPDNLQCIWCGMFMDRNALAMHFTELHPDEIEVPKCLLCLQELVINARLLEKYGEDFEVILPDEFHVKCHKFEQSYSSENALDRAIAKRVQKMQNSSAAETETNEEEDDGEDAEQRDSNVTNSRMAFGRRNRPKRSFVQPSLRQAVPANSKYVEAVTECQWKCKLCGGNIFGAVISAGAIKHYKQYHPGEMESMQYELCKARLERVSDGCMEFVHPQLVECLICNLTYALHKPYNMCRGIRHLKIKHPEMMPEYAGGQEGGGVKKRFRSTKREDVQLGEVIDDPEMVARFKNEYNVDFEKVQTLYQQDGEPVYVLLGENETLDADTARELARSIDDGDGKQAVKKEAPRATQVAGGDFDEEDPYGDLAEDDEMADIETKASTTRMRQRIVRGSRNLQSVGTDERAYLEMESEQKDHQMEREQASIDDGTVYQEEEVVEQQYEYYDENGQMYIDGRDGEYIDDGQMDEDFIDEVVYEDSVEQ